MRIKGMLGFLLLALTAQIAAADEAGNFYAAGFGTYIYPDNARNARNGGGGGGLIGIPLTEDLDLEVNGFSYFTRRKTSNNHDYGYGGGLDLRYPLADSKDFGLFFLGGLGAMAESINATKSISPYVDAGFSVSAWDLFGVPNLSLRTDARYYGVDHKDGTYGNLPAFAGKAFLNDVRFNVGLEWDFIRSAPRGDQKDSDGDGITDDRDACPNTPRGTVVDATGCPLAVAATGDSDGDGVPDAADKCPSTPHGVVVDAAGCPLPAPIPPPVVLMDSDGDGVPDSADQCPRTPRGMTVDFRGCPTDLDGDGVPNELDRCPNTPPGIRVDARGCAIEQTVVFHNINFVTASDSLTAESRAVLDGIAAGLLGQPSINVEIQGHTDSQGAQAYNLKLSQNRARAVKAYLISKGISPGRMQANGMGPFSPVASNATESGRAQNRRVEFKLLRK